MTARPLLLSFHAFEGSAGEGILTDAAVCSELDCRLLAVTTAVLAMRSGRVDALEPLSIALVAQQLESLLADGRPCVARTGILRGTRQIELVADLLRDAGLTEIVVAPCVRVAGTAILDEAERAATRERLFPMARCLLVRAAELGVWTGSGATDIEGLKVAASALREQGARSVLIAGAAFHGRVIDLLDEEGKTAILDAARLLAPRVPGLSGVHGAAVAAHLARGLPLLKAAEAAQRYVGYRLLRGR